MKNYTNIISIMLFISVFFFFSKAAYSQQQETKIEIEVISFEDLMKLETTTASKKAEKITDAPGIITIISRQEIEGFAGKNLGDILMRVVGVNLLSPDVFKEQSVVFRGQEVTPYNVHTLILLNGRPVRDPLTGGMNNTIWSSFPIDIIDQIEVIRGPGSVLYGSSAFSGVVNIITKKNKTDGIQGQGSVGGGSFGAFSQSAFVGVKMGDFKMNMAFRNENTTGEEFSFTGYDNKLGSANFFEKSLGVMANISYKSFTVNALYTKYDPYSLNGSEYFDPTLYSNVQTMHFFDLGYSEEVVKNIFIDANFTFNEHHWLSGYEPGPSKGWSPTYEANIKAIDLIKYLNVLVGGGYEESNWGGPLFHENSLYTIFLYSQLDYSINEKIKLIGGLQFNKIKGIDGNLSPRFGVIADITDNLGVKVLYSQAFRKGYPNETSFRPIVFRGNLALKPELINTLEAQLFYKTENMEHSITYYNSKMTDIITRNRYSDPSLKPPFYFLFLNGGEWKFWGVEYEGKYSIAKNLIGFGSFYYSQNENTNGVADATLHPSTMLKLGFLYNYDKFKLGVFNSFFSKPFKTNTITPASLMVNKEAEAYSYLTCKVSYDLDFTDKTDLILSVEGFNLLNTDIRYPDYPNKSVNTLLPLSSGASIVGTITVRWK